MCKNVVPYLENNCTDPVSNTVFEKLVPLASNVVWFNSVDPSSINLSNVVAFVVLPFAECTAKLLPDNAIVVPNCPSTSAGCETIFCAC